MTKRSSDRRVLRRLRRHLLPKCYGALRKAAYASIITCLGVRLVVIDIAPADGTTWYTRLARRATVTFADHTVIDLNAATLALLKDGPRRQVFLQEGEIHFSVQHGVSKPIDVHIGNIVLEDLGTNFDVSVHENMAIVVVTGGAVRVHEDLPGGSLADPIDVTGASHQRHPMILKKGDMIRLEQREGAVFAYIDRNDPLEAEMRTSWLTGEFESSGQRLDEVIQQFNRYNQVQMVVNDPTVARMKVGGHYSLTDIDSFLTDLRRVLGVETVPVVDSGHNVVKMNLLRGATATDTTCNPPHPPTPKHR